MQSCISSCAREINWIVVFLAAGGGCPVLPGPGEATVWQSTTCLQ